jgi:hypothetical protein
MATVPNTTPSSAIEQETPDIRIHRLARELADALNWYGDGCWSMHVYPSESRQMPLAFVQSEEPRCMSLH